MLLYKSQFFLFGRMAQSSSPTVLCQDELAETCLYTRQNNWCVLQGDTDALQNLIIVLCWLLQPEQHRLFQQHWRA